MEEQNENKKYRGGRPKKVIKRDQLLAIKCTLYERKIIEAKAKKSNLTVSEYLREIGLTAKIDYRNKALPKEILSFTGLLNHLAANLNQIAKKRNSNDELTPLERAELKVQTGQVKDLAVQIKNFMS
ncbi:mobilization protein [Flavobacterium sp. Fl-77]|uniref:Mobilization protein n=1 Tax=Flavobacterium flavipigmentatum TaxID=2893884 RepID=A0AAJ2S5F1_9FLAO|nr:MULTISPECIES: mobilization protein [unclassified Flavobacterium]MDX6180681.1 mobilization protein [Flavobacterium sp. Fl-33]MDX6184281.1 mobilization protein [Flavobacterium sp. Fl-77]UFH39393.1 mobilization protein [Flavobacterium sp. F-70]